MTGCIGAFVAGIDDTNSAAEEPTRAPLLDEQLDAAVDQARRPGRERDLGRCRGRDAGAHVEAALVVRALDLVPFEEAVAQARVAVGAAVRRREDAARDEIDRDLLAARL